jgi:hypothetical protein
MAKLPTDSAAPAMTDDDAARPSDDMGAPAAGDDAAADPDADTGEVLLTVCKEADGTYSLIKGDEDEPGEESAGGENANEQTFDSKGALLKGILDMLNEDEGTRPRLAR